VHSCLVLRAKVRVEDYYGRLSGDLSPSSCQLAVGEQLAFVLPSAVVPCRALLVLPFAVCAMFESFAGVPCSIVRCGQDSSIRLGTHC
jgi:hypothetical protein